MVSVRDVIEQGDYEAFAAALAPDVVWVGLLPGQLCRSRDEVLATFRGALEAGYTGRFEIVAETEDMYVVDPHVEPPLEVNPDLHQVFVFDEEHIIELRDFRDRRSALEAVGLA
jgi:ketosteroid isomerase-like protein